MGYLIISSETLNTSTKYSACLCRKDIRSSELINTVPHSLLPSFLKKLSAVHNLFYKYILHILRYNASIYYVKYGIIMT